MEEENISFTDFEEAFGETGDYQTGGDEEATAEEVTDSEVETETGDVDTAAEEQTNEEETSNEDPEKDKQETETFTLKINHEEKTYSREEVISLAQKGADYDRVKDQLTQSKQNAEELQSKLDGQQEAMTLLEDLAKESETDIPGLLRNLRIGLLKKQGLSEDAANERLLRLDAEKQIAALQAKSTETKKPETGAERAQRETAEFRENYPDVALSQELIDALMKDVQGGMTLTKAYQKYENAQKDARIAELQRQLEAEKQNKANTAASPGSMKDSGGKRSKSDFDDFMEAFN